jgi:hypothetical protein
MIQTGKKQREVAENEDHPGSEDHPENEDHPERDDIQRDDVKPSTPNPPSNSGIIHS